MFLYIVISILKYLLTGELDKSKLQKITTSF